MGIKFLSVFFVSRKPVTGFLIFSMFLELLGLVFIQAIIFSPRLAEAAIVVIDGTPNTTGSAHTLAGAGTVFISDQVGYKFFVRSTGVCAYRKSTNGGASWDLPVTVDSQTDCIGVSVWYDKWTPNDTGDYIHIATMDTSADELFYNRLDTNNDSLLLVTSTSTTLGSAAVYAVTTNRHSITKATDGKIYMTADDGNGTVNVSCSSSCNISTNWTTVGTAPQGNADSWSLLMPLSSGNIMMINRSTTNTLRYSTWNGSNWSSMNNIDASAIRNTTYDVGVAATLDTDTGDLYIAYVTDNNTFTVADHDIKTAVYTSGAWTGKTAVHTNIAGRGILQTAISRDQNTGDIYVAYSIRSTIGTVSTARIYWKSSTDDMTSWGGEQGPIDSVAGDYYGIDMNIMSYDRIYASWFDNTTAVRDIIGDTIANISPFATLSALGNQKTVVRSGTSNLHIGGAFLLETIATRTVSTIIVSENGTIDADNDIGNAKLFYDLDTSAPYNCVSESYDGGETQFGSTLSGGFNGANGSASFTASPLEISPTKSLCIYTVFNVLSSANDGDTIEVYVNNPKDDVLVSGGVNVYPYEAVAIASTTSVVNQNLNQNAFHWRNDNGNETGATSATGGVENTALSAMQANDIKRLRLGLANQGSTSSLPSTYRLEYGTSTPTCESISTWETIGTGGGIFNLYDSSNITNGNNTTNISVASGGVTDGEVSFIASNGGIRDTTVDTGTLTLDIDQFLELEYSIRASSSVAEGQTYCFRVTQNGTPLDTYNNYPSVTISADVTVNTFGSQIATVDIPATSTYAGGGFSIVENSNSRNVTSLTVYENGTIDADAGISNLRLHYDLDTTAPYNCASVSYSATDLRFGATSTSGFSDTGEKATFNDSVSISTTSAMCVYVVYDITSLAQNGEILDIKITSPSADVIASGGGSIGPSTEINIASTTSVRGGILTQTHYHWRNDNGNETGATSATSNAEDTRLTDFAQNSNIRLRLGVTNTGSVSSIPTRFQLEYSPMITTCDVATVWTDVDATGDGWEMNDSTFLTNGETTTNVSVANGGVTDENITFITSNGGVRDTESKTATTTISTTQHLDLEFSINSNEFAAYDTTYCFRVTSAGTPFLVYDNFAQVTTAPKRDFFIQRGSTTVSGTSTTLLAGTNYTAPASNTRAFVIITNSQSTGAGNNAGAGAAQNADDVTAYIEDSSNLSTSFRIARPPAATSNTRVDWEIIEFIGSPGTDNEIVVRNVNTVQLNSSTLSATGTVLSNVDNDSDVVVFVTGSSNRNASRNYYASQVTSEWDTGLQAPIFRRGANGASIIDVSYAVVEFVGINWNVQRAQHAYTAAGVTETESITAVNNLSRTFLHVQKRMGATTNVVHYGHEVWLSSIGAISFALETGASVAVEQTSVAWVIENTQTGVGKMAVQRSNGSTSGGTTPFSLSVTLTSPVSATNNTSVSANTRAAGANTTYPRPMAGFTLTATSTYQIWRSDTGSAMTYRTEIIEWPVADLSMRQNYYRFYADNNSLLPTDPWPVGATNLGENTSITANDEPLAMGERLRIRMSVQVANANMPAGFQDFKLQYGLRVSTCSAVAVDGWFDLGDSSSSTPWRGYSATGTTDGADLSGNPPTGGDLLLSVSDRAGSLVEINPSSANPFTVLEGENVEYDWFVEHNGANAKSTYCFRMIKNDGNTLDVYNNYPQIRTAGFTPTIKNWRWYDDINNETPSSALSLESVAPINVDNENKKLNLRVVIAEKRNVQGSNIKFKLQYSEDVTFGNATDVVATSSCSDLSIWCYEDTGAGIDNDLITTSVVSGADSCVAGVGDGCGTHNKVASSTSSHFHQASTTQEYSFYVRSKNSRVNAVYYFRLYDVTNDLPVTLANGASYPSLVIEGANLSFSVAGLPSGTTTSGVTTDTATTPNSVGFGGLVFGEEYIAAHRVTVVTNATEGYQVLKFARQQLLNSYGIDIPSIGGTNATPTAWAIGCTSTSTGCVGYHTTDATLRNGSTRFGAVDTYAGLSNTPSEVMYSSIPITDTHDIVYRIKVNELQEAGDYETDVVYLAIPSF
jgi:hypothetical protein